MVVYFNGLVPHQVKGTIFNELDDDKLLSIIDFNEFEEQFKIGTGLPISKSGDEVEGLTTQGSKRFKRPELQSLLEHNRLRNIGKKKKASFVFPIAVVIHAIVM